VHIKIKIKIDFFFINLNISFQNQTMSLRFEYILRIISLIYDMCIEETRFNDPCNIPSGYYEFNKRK